MGEWHFDIVESLPAGWAAVTPTIVPGSGSPDLFVLAVRDGVPRRFDLHYLEIDHRGRPQAAFWSPWFVFGFGGRAVFVHESDGRRIALDLDSYFSKLFFGDDFLLVISGSGILRIDRAARTVWRNDELGVDGVVVHAVDAASIEGDGEWDPPGGWRPFRISLATGTPLPEPDP